MSEYLVERTLTGITPDALQAAAQAAKDTAAAMRNEGVSVSYEGSTFVGDTEQSFCLFRAPDAVTVKQLNDRAQLPYDSIMAAARIDPDQLD